MTRATNLTTAALSLAQIPAGRITAFLKVGVPIEQRSHANRGPLTPPDPAFSIWGPIFSGAIFYALRAARRDEDSAVNRWAGLAFLGNTLWELEAQLRGFTGASVAVIASTAAAASAAFLEAERRGERLAANTFAALAGWLTVASAVNVEATLIQKRGRASASAEEGRAVVLASGATGVGVSLALLGRGNPFLAAAMAWGLGGVALRSSREGRKTLAGVAIGGIAAVTLATLLARTGDRSPSPGR